MFMTAKSFNFTFKLKEIVETAESLNGVGWSRIKSSQICQHSNGKLRKQRSGKVCRNMSHGG